MKPTPMASASSIADQTALRAAKDSARASTRQLVTISGRKIPSPAWIAGSQAASVSSTAVTAASRRRPNGLKSAEMVALENLPDSDVKEALQQIAPDFRLAVYLADVEGFPYKEIAEIMGTPIGTVMSRLNRGRTQLRGLLADYARERGVKRAEASRT